MTVLECMALEEDLCDFMDFLVFVRRVDAADMGYDIDIEKVFNLQDYVDRVERMVPGMELVELPLGN